MKLDSLQFYAEIMDSRGELNGESSSGRSLGGQLEARFIWAAIEHRLSIETGFALFEYGRYARDVQGPALRGDPRYFYLAATTTF